MSLSHRRIKTRNGFRQYLKEIQQYIKMIIWNPIFKVILLKLITKVQQTQVTQHFSEKGTTDVGHRPHFHSCLCLCFC